VNWRIRFVRQAQESATLNTSVHVHCLASLARQASCVASASRALERRQTLFHPRPCDDSLKSLHRRVVENRAQVQQGQVVLNNAVIGRNFDTGFHRVLKLRTSSWRGFLRKSWPHHKFGFRSVQDTEETQKEDNSLQIRRKRKRKQVTQRNCNLFSYHKAAWGRFAAEQECLRSLAPSYSCWNNFRWARQSVCYQAGFEWSNWDKISTRLTGRTSRYAWTVTHTLDLLSHFHNVGWVRFFPFDGVTKWITNLSWLVLTGCLIESVEKQHGFPACCSIIRPSTH